MFMIRHDKSSIIVAGVAYKLAQRVNELHDLGLDSDNVAVEGAVLCHQV